MLRISGNKLALFGLLAGLLFGLGVISFKAWLLNEIKSAVTDELVAACPDCTLTYDSFDLSFLTRRGTATNLKILEKGVPKLTFKSLGVDCGVKNILNRNISLDTFLLKDGYADGVGPDSVTFRFVDQLTTPLPPELDRPDRWRVTLETLQVKDLEFREPFGRSELLGKKAELFIARRGEAYDLSPTISELKFIPGNRPSESLVLGGLTASLTIDQGKTSFSALTLGRDVSSIVANGVLDSDAGNTLEGKIDVNIDSQYVGLPTWLRGQIVAQTKVHGEIGSPVVRGPLLTPNRPFEINFPNASQLSLDEVSGILEVDVRHGDPLVSLFDLAGKNTEPKQKTTLGSSESLKFSDASLTAGFNFKNELFSYGPFTVKDGTGSVLVRRDSASNAVTILANVNDIAVNSIPLGPAKINLSILPERVDFSVDTTNQAQGALHADGSVSTPPSSDPRLESCSLQLKEYRYPLQPTGELSPIAITTETKLFGPLDLRTLSGSGNLQVSFPATKDHSKDSAAVSGKLTLKDGVFTADLPESSYGASALLRLNVAPPGGSPPTGTLTAKLSRSNLQPFLPKDGCHQADAALSYDFQLGNPLSGNGTLTVNTLSVGCAPSTLSVPGGIKLPVVLGALKLDGVTLSGKGTSVGVRGTLGIAKGYDTTLSGDLQLSSLLPLLPAAEELRGDLKASINVTGPLSAPVISGSGLLKSGEIALSSSEIAANDITGELQLIENTVKVNRLSGTLNSGAFEVTGVIQPFDLLNSKLTTRFNGVSIAPIDGTELSISGEIELTRNDSARAVARGTVRIDSAELSKDLNPNRLMVQAIAGYFSTPEINAKQSTQAPDLDLNLSITGSRNIFVITSLLSAELNADLKVRGTAADPLIAGKMEVLNGWLGLRDNRFEITSGSFTFRPGSNEPYLDIVSEGTLHSTSGENILVVLEARGALTSPRISLTSDQGLSNEQLLVLLTSSRLVSGQTRANSVNSQSFQDERYFLSSDTFLSIGSFFNNLTRIDSLAFEPYFNPFTGQTEPAIVGRKNLADRLSLIGLSTFGAFQNARTGLTYDLTKRLNASSFIETVPSRQNTALRADLTYTVLSQQLKVVDFTFTGLNELDEQDLLSAARISQSSKIKKNEETFATIRDAIRNRYVSAGFLNASVDLTCTDGEDICSHLSITVTEGEQFKVSSITFQGTELPESVRQALDKIDTVDETASKALLENLEQTLIVSARSEGYLSARATLNYASSPTDDSAVLIVHSDLREPVSFVFSGNTVFSPKEFLDSIQVFTRKRPFGNNTIRLLVQSIERMYQERGYLLAEITESEVRGADGRLVYTVKINEELSHPVRKLEIIGNNSVSLHRIKVVMRELGLSSQLRLFEPTYAIPDQLEILTETLVSVFQNEGFPDATATFEIIPDTQTQSVDIRISVVEGAAIRISSLTLAGIPEGIESPPIPDTPTSIPQLNRFTTQLIESLRDQGFFYPSVTNDFDDSTSHLSLAVIPGQRTTVSSITFDGLSSSSIALAKKYSSVQSNQPYSATSLNETKRQLLRSGLFSRVEIVPQDGALDTDKEALIVKLTERPLQTLNIGGGANSEFGAHLFGEAVDRSFLSDGQSLAFRVDSYFNSTGADSSSAPGISQGFTSLRYVNPTVLDSEISLSEELRYQRQDTTTFPFNQDRVSLASYLYSPISPAITLSAGHTILVDNLDSVRAGSDVGDYDSGSVRIGFISALLSVDKRDDPLLPQSGYTFSLEPKVASTIFGSEPNFATITTRASTILPLDILSPRFSLGLSAAGGFGTAWGNTDEIPITQRYFLGGRTTVRGFRENSLGPRSVDGDIIGGDSMVMFKTQLQYLAANSISTHFFLDNGTVFLRSISTSSSDIRSAAGVGFRYLSPIGPLGVDVGHPLQERGGEPGFRFHFSVGSAF